MHKKGGVRIPRKSITNGATGRAHVESDWSWPIQSVTDWSQRWSFKLWLSHTILLRKFGCVFQILICFPVSLSKRSSGAAKIKPIKSGCFWQSSLWQWDINHHYVGIFFNCFAQWTNFLILFDYLTFSWWEDPVTVIHPGILHWLKTIHMRDAMNNFLLARWSSGSVMD